MSKKPAAKYSSVDSSKYHHGDLRQSLLQAATAMIGTSGIAALSMRKLADQVGVSRMAPYHHFKDKNALLCAIAEQGFERKNQSLDSIAEQSNDLLPRQQFEQYVDYYIRFAAQNSEHYDLMFSRDIWKNNQASESLKVIAHDNFQRWVGWIDKLQQQGLFDQKHSALRTAQVTWGTLHGLCRLLNDGVYTNLENLEQISQTAVDMLLKDG
ncbi:TetR/AcrR family transcriptional regulator [Pelagibaculum spongiae]|uniref:TetR family transcriptional regulator n=1 Tax=Pelagibaculum spongiae TaxID=2080658 RepID=A0A2V1H0Q3_9GAMM|nr:TetR/AcrR family transcriptional regulator [Pelagibaculum spongiae]PVZ72053.1 TetR family transcriptional regulator [Pelagibaculum spongiae]